MAMNKDSSLPIEIDVQSLKTILDQNDPLLLLDCRRPEEHQFAQIRGNVFIPMDQLPDRIAELDNFKERPIVVYCHLGARSLMVTEWLRANGFPTARSLAGGIDAWSESIDTTVPRYQ